MSTRAGDGSEDHRARPRVRVTGQRRLADLWALARPGTALADAVPLAAGALAVDHPGAGTVLLVAAAGVLLSVHGGLLDAVAGLPGDRLSPARRGSPLVRGRLTARHVLVVAVVAGLAVVVGGLLGAPSTTARLGFAVLVALRAALAATRVPGTRVPAPARCLLTLVAVGGRLPLGVLAAGGTLSGGVWALGAGFGLAALVTGCTVVNLTDLATDRVVGRRTTALAAGVRLRWPRGFVFPGPYVAIVVTAQVGVVGAVSAAAGLAVFAAEGGAEALRRSTSAAPAGGVGAAVRTAAAGAAVAVGLAAVLALARLLRTGAPGLDPIRPLGPRGSGFVRLNLLACHLASAAWILGRPGGPSPWALLPAAAGWLVVLLASLRERTRLRTAAPPG